MVQAKKFRAYTDELVHNAKIEKYLDQPASGSAAPAAPAQRLRLRPLPRRAAPAAPAATAPTPAAAPGTAAPAKKN